MMTRSLVIAALALAGAGLAFSAAPAAGGASLPTGVRDKHRLCEAALSAASACAFQQACNRIHRPCCHRRIAVQ